MNSEWTETTLGEFCSFSYGKGLPERNRRTGTVPVISSAGIIGYHNEALVKTGGIVIGRKGTVGSVTLSKKPFWAIDTAFFIADEPQKRDLFFTYYLLKTLNLPKMNSDSAVPGLNRGNAHALPVNIPPPNLQRKISSILGALDDRILLLRNTNVTLEAIAQALFKSWFVDFDPVYAKVDGRTPEGIDAETAALFPDSFEKASLDLVPKGWKVEPIGDVVQVLGGGTPSTKESIYWHPETHHWATPKDLSGIAAPVLLNTGRKISDHGLAKISSGLLPVNTLLLSSRAPIGYLAIAKIPTAINQGFIAILPHIEISAEFLLIWCRQNMELIKQKANGSTFMEINKSSFRSIQILRPTIDVINSFTKITSLLFDRIAENECQAQTLVTLRDTLLPRLIAGHLRLPKAGEIIGAHS